MRKRVLFPIAYTSFCVVFLTIAACSKASPKSKKDDLPFVDTVSCDDSKKAFDQDSKLKKMSSTKLTRGAYEYVRGEVFFDGTVNGALARYHASETAQGHWSNPTAVLSFDCYEGFVKTKALTFQMDEPVAPRVVAIFEEPKRNLFLRKYEVISYLGQPSIEFKEAGSVLDQSPTDAERKLREGWDTHGFIHADVNTYQFIAKRKLVLTDKNKEKEGTLMVKITYRKRDGNALSDGSFFIAPMGDVSYSLWDQI